MPTEKPKEVDESALRCLAVAEQVKLLFGFCAQLIPDKEIILKTMDLAIEKQNDTMAMAPIIGAFGRDYREAEVKSRTTAERAKALYDLIDCLERTELEVQE
jgi:hypothetical protein